jgi:hypothetical protein
MRASIWASLIALVAARAFAEAPFSFDASPGRLPKDGPNLARGMQSARFKVSRKMQTVAAADAYLAARAQAAPKR